MKKVTEHVNKQHEKASEQPYTEEQKQALFDELTMLATPKEKKVRYDTRPFSPYLDF